MEVLGGSGRDGLTLSKEKRETTVTFLANALMEGRM